MIVTGSALDSGSSGFGSSVGWGHYVVFLSKKLYSQCLSSPRYTNGYRRIQCWGLRYDGLAAHPRGVEILLVTLCSVNRSLGSYANFSFRE